MSEVGIRGTTFPMRDAPLELELLETRAFTGCVYQCRGQARATD